MSIEAGNPNITSQRHEVAAGIVKHIFASENGKTMTVSVFPDTTVWPKPCALTLIENGPDHVPVPGTTTALYKAAREAMQEEADASGNDILYLLTTESPVMKKWALGAGSEVFAWDKRPDQVPQGRLQLATYIRPRVLEE
jgi:hypothetical protein